MENKILLACQHLYVGYAIYVNAICELLKLRRTFIYIICKCLFLI